MKCNAVIDLLPLYEEDLCSQETKKEIDEHIKTCEKCRKSYENVEKKIELNLKSSPQTNNTNPFKKVKKVMKKNKLVTIIVSVVLFVVIAGFALMTVSQVMKLEVVPNFEKIEMAHDSKLQVEKFFEGDIKGFLSEISIANIDYQLGVNNVYDSALKNLTETYEKYVMGKDYKVTNVSVSYIDVVALGVTIERKTMCSQVDVLLDGEQIQFLVSENAGTGFYSIYIDSYSEKEGADNLNDEFVNTMNYYTELDRSSIYDYILAKLMLTTEERNYQSGMMKNRVGEESSAKIANFVSDGTKIVESYNSARIFDVEKDKYSFNLILVAEDSHGKKAVLNQKVYFNSDLSYDFDVQEVDAIGDFDEAKMQEFENLFK